MSVKRQRKTPARLSTRINVEFLTVKIRAAQMQPELSRLDQELEAYAARLKDRSDLSPTAKASAISQIEQARAVLRSHAETLRKAAANLTDWTTAGQEIDALAEILNMQGDQILRAVNDEIARQDGDADQLVATAVTYRTAITQLVEAARKARGHSQVVGGSRGGGDNSEAKALEEYRDLQKRFPAILGSRTPVVAKRKLGGRGSGFWYQVRLTEDSRERATALCIQLRSAGGECLVQQPLNVKTKPTFKPNDDVTDPSALKGLLGLSLADMSIDLRKRYKIADRFEGVVVMDAIGGSPTIAKSLLPGDVIVEVSGEPVMSSDDFWIKLDRLRKAGRESALLTVARGGGNLRLVPLSLTRP